ncbi:MAG TPA: TlpA disulfide reductase family protein [Niabella sp.]|nr:TlpA disulfide reductase family protein [Niabella sp.]
MKKTTLLGVMAEPCLLRQKVKCLKPRAGKSAFKKVLFIQTAFAVFLCMYANAQQATIKPLKINDRLPDIEITNILNYNTPTATISSLQRHNKLLLLDFWFTSCAPCIKQIPKLDSLQQLFKDRLQILMVTFEPDSLVKKFVSKWEQQHDKTLTIPIATADTILQQYFNQASRPNYAWIAADRVNMGYSSSTFISASIIEQVLIKMQLEVQLRGYLPIGD